MRPITYRAVSQEEFPNFLRAEISAYSDTGDEDAFDRFGPVFEPDRSVAAFDGDQIVGTLCSLATEITVPGGSADCAALTFVAVRPTHRRRGILTSMMRQHLDQLKEIGEPLATLHASESSIYWHFGYGLASHSEGFTIESKRGGFRSPEPAPGELRMVDIDTARQLFPPAYDLAARSRPGTYARNETHWDLRFWPKANEKSFFVAYVEDGETLGYVIYRSRGTWEAWIPKRSLVVEEMIWASRSAHRGLWEYLFSVDVIENVTTQNQPMDDPLPWILQEPRRVQRRHVDAIWNRVLDAPKALEARRYLHDGSLTLNVVDEAGGWAAGTFKLDGGPLGATCTPTDAGADLTLTAEDLGAIYFGGVKPSVLAAAGRIVENSPSAVATADSMFGWSSMPWCPAVEPQI